MISGDTAGEFAAGKCDACEVEGRPLLKLSLGRDFFGRVYDRLSPSSDQSPKWYCEPCSVQKNLQRDYRDIRTEFEKLNSGQPSELTTAEQLQRAHLRLRELAALLSGSFSGSRLVDPAEVSDLLGRIQAKTGNTSVAG